MGHRSLAINTAQKIVTALALVGIAMTLAFAPWTYTIQTGGFRMGDTQTAVERRTHTVSGPIWSPHPGGQLAIATLFTEWVAIGILWGGTMLICRSPKPLPNKPPAAPPVIPT